MKKTLAFIAAVALAASGCSTTRYCTYYQNGQVQQEYHENVLVGTLNGIWTGVWGTVGMVLGYCFPPPRQRVYYTCPGH
jgi:hypothetical protein